MRCSRSDSRRPPSSPPRRRIIGNRRVAAGLVLAGPDIDSDQARRRPACSRASAGALTLVVEAIRLITARSAASRNSRAGGFPSCGKGSASPPRRSRSRKPSICRKHLGILVEPGREPDRVGEKKSSPATRTDRIGSGLAGRPDGSSFSAPIVARCARSASSARRRAAGGGRAPRARLCHASRSGQKHA